MWDFITPTIWNAIFKRLLHPISVIPPSDRITWPSFPFDESRPFDGIFNRVTHLLGGNVQDKGFVRIKSSSCEGPSYPARNVVDFEGDNVFGTKDFENSWISFDFMAHRVRPTHYSLRSYHPTRYWRTNHPQSWVIEVSDDDISWTVIDRRQNISELSADDTTVTFSISHPVECRFIRLRQTGPSHTGRCYLELGAFELFGSVGGELSQRNESDGPLPTSLFQDLYV
jgi:hypothetical protein